MFNSFGKLSNKLFWITNHQYFRQKNLFHISHKFLIFFDFLISYVVAFLLVLYFGLILILFFIFLNSYYFLFFLIFYTEFTIVFFNYYCFTLVFCFCFFLCSTIKNKFFFFTFLSCHFFDISPVSSLIIGPTFQFFCFLPIIPKYHLHLLFTIFLLFIH